MKNLLFDYNNNVIFVGFGVPVRTWFDNFWGNRIFLKLIENSGKQYNKLQFGEKVSEYKTLSMGC